MKATTTDIHESLKTLGRALGMYADGEVSDSLLRVRLSGDAAYRPRIDVLWSLTLDEKQRAGLAWALDLDVADVKHLPIVGIEVEATGPSTKTMEADVANICALGAPLGLLVVTESGEEGIYRRAARAIRSVRRSFGDIKVLPVEAGWLPNLIGKKWPKGNAQIPTVQRRNPAGGENPEWSVPTRGALRRVGEQSGFVVAEPYVPPVLARTFEHAKSNWKKPLCQTTDPAKGERKAIASASKYLAESKIDMAWLLPLPKALSRFIEALVSLDPCIADHGMVFPDLWTHVPVVAFELENSPGKHAGGGLLNLAAYGVVGVVVARTETTAASARASLMTYQPTLGLRNVFVRTMP